MRKIKFRGKTLDNGEWVFGKLLQLSMPEEYFILPIGGEASPALIYDSYEETGKYIVEAVKVTPETIGQFTGLKDKNGKEIYEGDLLKTRIGGYEQASPYVVEDMRKLYFELKRDDSYYRIQQTVIIGNIYENPELMTLTND